MVQLTKTVMPLMVCGELPIGSSWVTGRLWFGFLLKTQDLSARLLLLWEVPYGGQSAIEFKFFRANGDRAYL
jgi:hypothetical protein